MKINKKVKKSLPSDCENIKSKSMRQKSVPINEELKSSELRVKQEFSKDTYGLDKNPNRLRNKFDARELILVETLNK